MIFLCKTVKFYKIKNKNNNELYSNIWKAKYGESLNIKKETTKKKIVKYINPIITCDNN
jgi:hypothetical protein